MKFSEKGIDKLFYSKGCYYDEIVEDDVVTLFYIKNIIKFEPEDFQDAVILTVEEAKEIYKVLDNCLDACIQEYESRNEYDPERLIRSRFKDRIKQAEKENETE